MLLLVAVAHHTFGLGLYAYSAGFWSMPTYDGLTSLLKLELVLTPENNLCRSGFWPQHHFWSQVETYVCHAANGKKSRQSEVL